MLVPEIKELIIREYIKKLRERLGTVALFSILNSVNFVPLLAQFYGKNCWRWRFFFRISILRNLIGRFVGDLMEVKFECEQLTFYDLYLKRRKNCLQTMIFHSSIEPVYFILPLVGFVVGLFGTMLGGGGGFFFLPILTLLVGVPAQTAVITSLVAALPICLVGALGHYRKSNINLRIGLLFSLTGILGAFAGARVTGMVSPEQLKAGFGVYSIFIALNMILGVWKKKRAEAGQSVQTEVPAWSRKAKGSIFGLFAGFITGTFGTSGTAPVLAGLFSMGIPFKLVVGTSLMVVLVNTLFAVGAHFLVGRIDLMLVYFLTAGSIVGAILGPKILTKVKTNRSENKVRYLYALVMVAIGILMIVG